MKEAINLQPLFGTDDVLVEAQCAVCGNIVGIVHVANYRDSNRALEISCPNCVNVFYQRKQSDCYLCHRQLKEDFIQIQIALGKYNICSSHNDAEASIRDKINNRIYEWFVNKFGNKHNCFYCPNTINISSYSELKSAQYVQKYLESGVTEFSSPLCCDSCHQLIGSNRLRVCKVCGKEVKSGIFCSMKCNILFCEN